MTPEENRAKVRTWNAANPERVLANRNLHKAATRQRRARHYAANRPLYIAMARSREERVKYATPRWADLRAIAKVYAEAARLTSETGVQHHVDHEIPLYGKLVCGLHVHTNLRAILATDNMRKRNSFETR